MKEKERLYYNLEEDKEETLYRIPDDVDEEDVDQESPDSGENRTYTIEEDYPYAYGVVSPDDDDMEDADEDENTDSAKNDKKSSPWKLLLKTMFSPVEGWKALKRSRISSEAMAAAIFYPICGLAAISEFVPMLYDSGLVWTQVFISAVIVFISFFFSNLLIPPFGKLVLGEGAKEMIESNYGRTAVMVLLSTLGIFKIVFNLLPPLDVVTVFLPIWTIYMISRLPATLRTPKGNKNRVAVLMSVLTIGLPYLWTRLLEVIL